MILMVSVFKQEGRKVFAFICIIAVFMFFSSSAYSDELLSQAPAVQEKQVADSPSAEKKNFSFLPGQINSNTASKSTKNDAVTNTDALSVSLGLIFILILIFSMAWFMKKMGYTNLTGQGQLKIIATLNLGQKEKIALIQVGQQQLLVGMTATQINTLHVLDECIEETGAQTKDPGDAAGNNPFADKLSKLLNNTQKNIK